MTGRKALVGLSLLCALAFTAFSAASASAATSGTTAVTCVPDPTNHGDFTDAHCDTTSITPGTGPFKHVAIPQDTPTAVTYSNVTTGGVKVKPVLEATVGGINTKLEATDVDKTCTLTNTLTGTVHAPRLTNCVATYTGVMVVNPANCTVHSTGQPAGTVKTASLKSEEVGVGTEGMEVKFVPEVGTTFTTLEFEGASCALNGVKATVTGSVLGTQQGKCSKTVGSATIRSAGATLKVNVSKASAQLKVGGQNASLTATTTLTMEEGDPIGTTEENIL